MMHVILKEMERGLVRLDGAVVVAEWRDEWMKDCYEEGVFGNTSMC